ncbi:cytochrome P450 71AP13 [Setaria viridis]|uniref:Cytochrome P450 n=1 Tax=Setaria viridis TaxID=4556 RepID=A0A4U6UEB5_SETVI|nr:flavonoid 3',5'-hydroxylase-like [Setaria viridis]TKW12019.1 hypothetical protein SEVIR_5G010100v2 [Setaria viridis]
MIIIYDSFVAEEVLGAVDEGAAVGGPDEETVGGGVGDVDDGEQRGEVGAQHQGGRARRGRMLRRGASMRRYPRTGMEARTTHRRWGGASPEFSAASSACWRPRDDSGAYWSHHIPAGTRVVINAWAIGRDPATWEDAEEFLPERFSGSAVDFRGQHFELVPFGAGRRGCPGLGLAEASIEMALTSLLYHFDWEAAGGTTGPSSLDMTEMNGISVHIKSGLQLVAKPWIP